MVKMLAMESTKKLSFFPPKGGVSAYYSPRMILHQEAIDYDKHCSISFGSYVQAHDEPEPTNSQKPRTLDCVYLRYVSNRQGGHELLDLRTGRTIRRRRVTEIPITQSVIDIVHTMATKDGMADGLKITTKFGIISYDTASIAGVENNENNNPSLDNYHGPLDDDEDDDDEDDLEERDEMDPNEIADIQGAVAEPPSRQSQLQTMKMIQSKRRR